MTKKKRARVACGRPNVSMDLSLDYASPVLGLVDYERAFYFGALATSSASTGNSNAIKSTHGEPFAHVALCGSFAGPNAYIPGVSVTGGCPSYATSSFPEMRIIRSFEVCECRGSSKFAGSFKKMSALFLAGSPWSTAISQPLAKIGGHGDHLSFASAPSIARAGSPVLSWASAEEEISAVRQRQRKHRFVIVSLSYVDFGIASQIIGALVDVRKSRFSSV